MLGSRSDHRSNTGRLLRTDEAAEILGLSPRTLEALRVRGGGPTYLKVGRLVRYDREDIDGWLEGQRRVSTSDPGGAA